jgi:hypothetical protein
MKVQPRGARRSLMFATLATALVGLAGCSILGGGRAGPVATMPSVTLNERNEIVVDQEPILVDSRNPKPIVFELRQDSGLRFASPGIVVEGEVLGTEPVAAADNNLFRRVEAPRDGKPAAFVTLLNKGQQTIQCKNESELRVVCAVVSPRPGSSFLYTIRINKGGVIYTLDPSIRTM